MKLLTDIMSICIYLDH